MQEKLSREDVLHVARLIRIYISEKEIEKYQSQLNTVLDSLEVFREIDTDGVDITAQVTGLTNVFREDEIGQSLTQDEALQNRPDSNEGFFEVKKVIKK